MPPSEALHRSLLIYVVFFVTHLGGALSLVHETLSRQRVRLFNRDLPVAG